jgi:hypothetical protein
MSAARVCAERRRRSSLAWGLRRRPWAELTVALLFAASGVGLIISSVRGRRLHRGAVVVDAVIGVGVLLAAPLFQPRVPEPTLDRLADRRLVPRRRAGVRRPASRIVPGLTSIPTRRAGGSRGAAPR